MSDNEQSPYWKYRRYGSGDDKGYTITAHKDEYTFNGDPVAFLGDSKEVSMAIDDVVNAHNAAIAAIPDMLAALRKAHRMLTRDYIDDAKMAVIDMVDAAIAKATGETE